MATHTEHLATVIRYHERTKHRPNQFARSLGYMDWATQPHPFRFFDGAPQVALDRPDQSGSPRYDDLFDAGRIAQRSVDRASISRLFFESLALSAWKQAPGVDRWPLRVNPSSGNLHPTEGYLIAPAINGIADTPGVYHYYAYAQALEQRRELTAAQWSELIGPLPSDTFFVALSSVYWRESWKYGERAFRYCHHDVGHAIGAIAIAARAAGWTARLLDPVADDALAVLLGVHTQGGIEAEHPDALLALFPTQPPLQEVSWTLPGSLIKRLASTPPVGQPNRLSRDHHEWSIIDAVAAATKTTAEHARSATLRPSADMCGSTLPARDVSASHVVRTRRSALAMDRHTSISADSFYRMAQRWMAAPIRFPYDVLPWPPHVVLGMFVHRVDGLTPGLYVLVRDPRHEASLRQRAQDVFIWRRPNDCPDDVVLYQLYEGDFRQLARDVSCYQDIASDGAFSFGMLAHFDPALHQHGPRFYPRLFWETGLIGQVAYLEAEAAGIRSTGIGCFLDDVMHEILGLSDRTWQSLYHFTIGGAIEDLRLQTLAPYAHLDRQTTG